MPLIEAQQNCISGPAVYPSAARAGQAEQGRRAEVPSSPTAGHGRRVVDPSTAIAGHVGQGVPGTPVSTPQPSSCSTSTTPRYTLSRPAPLSTKVEQAYAAPPLDDFLPQPFSYNGSDSHPWNMDEQEEEVPEGLQSPYAPLLSPLADIDIKRTFTKGCPEIRELLDAARYLERWWDAVQGAHPKQKECAQHFISGQLYFDTRAYLYGTAALIHWITEKFPDAQVRGSRLTQNCVENAFSQIRGQGQNTHPSLVHAQGTISGMRLQSTLRCSKNNTSYEYAGKGDAEEGVADDPVVRLPELKAQDRKEPAGSMNSGVWVLETLEPEVGAGTGQKEAGSHALKSMAWRLHDKILMQCQSNYSHSDLTDDVVVKCVNDELMSAISNGVTLGMPPFWPAVSSFGNFIERIKGKVAMIVNVKNLQKSFTALNTFMYGTEFLQLVLDMVHELGFGVSSGGASGPFLWAKAFLLRSMHSSAMMDLESAREAVKNLNDRTSAQNRQIATSLASKMEIACQQAAMAASLALEIARAACEVSTLAPSLPSNVCDTAVLVPPGALLVSAWACLGGKLRTYAHLALEFLVRLHVLVQKTIPQDIAAFEAKKARRAEQQGTPCAPIDTTAPAEVEEFRLEPVAMERLAGWACKKLLAHQSTANRVPEFQNRGVSFTLRDMIDLVIVQGKHNTYNACFVNSELKGESMTGVKPVMVEFMMHLQIKIIALTGRSSFFSHRGNVWHHMLDSLECDRGLYNAWLDMWKKAGLQERVDSLCNWDLAEDSISTRIGAGGVLDRHIRSLQYLFIRRILNATAKETFDRQRLSVRSNEHMALRQTLKSDVLAGRGKAAPGKHGMAKGNSATAAGGAGGTESNVHIEKRGRGRPRKLDRVDTIVASGVPLSASPDTTSVQEAQAKSGTVDDIGVLGRGKRKKKPTAKVADTIGS